MQTDHLASALGDRYRIERELGQGGMATVYVAEDVKHRRRVALKVLKPELAAVIGADRFLREIETTAKLQHPHILPLHDSGVVEGTAFYVMPYVEGESLRDRLRRDTQLPVDDAVRIAREVASALDYAHRQGVVHRDIKPENILLHEGQALVADFGIALAVSSAGGGTRMTETGMSLGTPHYMSPEQAMGEREITPRADVYALGCVLYEMLLGEPPFTGPSAQAVIARVLTEDPRDITAQRRTVPPHVDAAVRRALQKLPADRFGSAAEFSAALANPAFATAAFETAALRRRTASTGEWLSDWRTIAALALAAIGVVAARTLSHSGARADDALTVRMVVSPPDSQQGLTYSGRAGAPAVSRDGKTVAFSVLRRDSTVLYIRPVDGFVAREVPGSGERPFFSPDSRQLGFFRQGVVWRVPVGGGDPVRIGAIDEAEWNIYGAVWPSAERILIFSHRGAWALTANGGTPTMWLPADTGGRGYLVTPSIAPSGAILANPVGKSGAPGTAGVGHPVLISPDGKTMRDLSDGIEPTAWFVGDVLTFRRGGQRFAGYLDERTLEVKEAVPVTGLPTAFTVGGDGPSAAYIDVAGASRVELVWVSPTGVITPTGLPIGQYRHPRLSRDGRYLVASVRLPGEATSVTVRDLREGTRVQLGSGGGEPAWANDGSAIYMWVGDGRGSNAVLRWRPDGSGLPDTTIALSPTENYPTDVSAGDSLLVYYGGPDARDQDIYVLNLRTKATRRLELRGNQRGGRLSPDGRWLAYNSTENGPSEVIVRPWPSLEPRTVVSAQEGGEEPVWSRDGKSLFYRNGSRIMAVRVTPGPTFVRSAPTVLFSGSYPRDVYGDQSYDVAPDGRFLMIRLAPDARVDVHVILNWEAELRRQLAASKK